MAVCILVVNKVGDEVIEAWFDEMIIAPLISSEATMEATKKRKNLGVLMRIKNMDHLKLLNFLRS